MKDVLRNWPSATYFRDENGVENVNDHLVADDDGNWIPRPRAVRYVNECDRVTMNNLQSWRNGVTGFIQYHRKNGRVRGVTVVQYDHNSRSYRIGWSMCSPNEDRNNMDRGRAIAFNRLNVNGWVSANDIENGLGASYAAYIPHTMQDAILVRLQNMHKNSTSPANRVRNVPV